MIIGSCGFGGARSSVLTELLSEIGLIGWKTWNTTL